jgi:hypothetical protein
MKQYLYVVDDAIVAKVASRSVSGRGEGVRSDVEQGAVAAIGDVERGNRDWGAISMISPALAGRSGGAYSEPGRAGGGRSSRLSCC